MKQLGVVILLLMTSTLPVARAANGETCEFSESEQRMAELLVEHEQQQRKNLECDVRLQQFARDRANDMIERDYFGHVTPDRVGPNQLLRETGYELPKYYVGGIANSVESILGGEAEPEKAWKRLLASNVHRAHLLGTDSMYARQQRFGVAHVHVPASKYAHYWVIVVAENGKEDRPMTCTPSPPVCIVH